MKEIVPFSQKEKEAIRAIMFEYITNCKIIIISDKTLHGFYAVNKKG